MSIKNNWKLIAAVTIVTVAGAMASVLTAKAATVTTMNGEDVDSQELRSIIVEGWEKEAWVVEANPAAPESKIEANIVEGRPKNLSFDENNKNSMGLRYRFVYPGNSTVTITPPESRKVKRFSGQLDENNEPKFYETAGIELPGRVVAVSVWVLGRGNEYNLECWIEDWKGDTHIYDFGSLDFIGWRPLSIEIPASVPQDVESYPQTKTLVLKKFVVRSTPYTSQEEVVFFFDTLKVLTDMFDLHFDGAEMHFDDKDKQDKERMKAYQDQLKSNYEGKSE